MSQWYVTIAIHTRHLASVLVLIEVVVVVNKSSSGHTTLEAGNIKAFSKMNLVRASCRHILAITWLACHVACPLFHCIDVSSRVATVREKYLENEIFFRSGKVREFCGWPGNLERTWKVREFENKGLWQAVSRNLFILSRRGKDVLSHIIVLKPISLFIWGYS